MRYRLLGRTGLYVSELALGTMNFGGGGFWDTFGSLGQSAVNEQVKLAFDAGINLIDTANIYSFGQSEALVGQALKDLGLPRDELVVATKAYVHMGQRANQGGLSRYHLMHAVDASLKRLQLDHIDLYQLHAIDPLTPLEETLSALDDIVRSGKVRYIGLCNAQAWKIMKGLGISERNGWRRFESVQSYYSIAGRDVEREILPLARDQQLGVLVWSPLAGGLLSGKYAVDNGDGGRRSKADFPPVDRPRAQRCIETMKRIGEEHQVSVAQIALAWLLSRAEISSVIVGASKVEQLRQNIGACNVKLTEEEIRLLDEASALPVEYPGWMLDFQEAQRLKAPVR